MTDPTGVRVDVRWADLRSADVALAERLPASERARALAPERPADRGRRLVAAALLQEAVAAARVLGDIGAGGEGLVADAGPFEVDRTCEECGEQHGRPVVRGGPHVSVSHAGVLVVVATCWDAPVGVDVELLDRFAGGSPELAHEWTAREACFKATGRRGVGGGAVVTNLRPPAGGYVAGLAVGAPGAEIVAVEHRGTLAR